MTNYKGRDFLLKNGTWSGGTAVADCKTHSLKLNNELVDITNKSSGGYRTLLSGAGTQSVQVTLGGVMTTDSAFETLQGYAFANSINAHALGWADGDTLEGSFQVSSFEVTGEFNGAQTFTATLESSGQWTFTGVRGHMATLSIQTLAVTGLNPTLGAASTADTFTNDGNTVLLFVNGNASSRTLTLTVQNATVTQPGYNPITLPNPTVTLPGSGTNGGVAMVGPFGTGQFNDGNGQVDYALDVATGMTVAAVKVPRVV